MLNLLDLQYLVAFKELGTLTKVSEKYNISPPTITRAMKNIEAEFHVTLFSRSKNKIELNQAGLRAVEHACILLQNVQNAIDDVQAFYLSLRTITVKSCAPMPLWDIIPKLSDTYPNMTISSAICQTDDIIQAIDNKSCDIGIIPFELKNTNLNVKFYNSESLFICVNKGHVLADRQSVSFDDINGFNFLLKSQLDFWDTLCRKKMPASRFLVQTDDFEFEELVKNSSLPSFVTDKSVLSGIRKEYIQIPITDSEATVNFYTVIQKSSLFQI